MLLVVLALSPAAYRTQAAGVCKAGAVAQAIVAARLSVHPTRAQALAVWPTLLALGRKEVRNLGQLEAPAGLRPAHEAAVAAKRSQLDLFAQALAAVRAGEAVPQASAGMEPELVRLVASERAAWRRAGVAVCAQSA